MLRILVVFVLLFAGAAATLALLPTPPRVVASRAATPDQPVAAVPPAPPHSEIRVVYPAPSGGTASNPPTPPATTPGPAGDHGPAVGPAVPAASADPQPATASAAEAVPPADAVPPTPSTNLNLNTASIEALDQIPGAGRIGRTIAAHRPYHSVEELLTKRVIRKSVYDRIKDQVAAQ